jgi:hypothetical protein
MDWIIIHIFECPAVHPTIKIKLNYGYDHLISLNRQLANKSFVFLLLQKAKKKAGAYKNFYKCNVNTV